MIQSSVISVRPIYRFGEMVRNLFYEPTDLFTIFYCGNRKTQSENDIMTKKENHEPNQKKRRNEREQDIYTTWTPGGTPGDHAPKAENFAALADKSKNDREEAVRLF